LATILAGLSESIHLSSILLPAAGLFLQPPLQAIHGDDDPPGRDADSREVRPIAKFVGCGETNAENVGYLLNTTGGFRRRTNFSQF
jgi:hypothetical protein